MNKATKWIGGAAVATLVGLSASALAFGGHGGRHHGFGGPFASPFRMAVIAERLELTTVQRDQIEDAIHRARLASRDYVDRLVSSRERLHEQLSSATFDEAAIRSIAKAQAADIEELMVLQAKSYAEIRALLTPEQQAKLDEMRSHHRHYRG